MGSTCSWWDEYCYQTRNQSFKKRFAGISFCKSPVFFADSLQPVVAVSIQDYCNIETFSAPVRRFLDFRRFLLKKQYESTNFGMILLSVTIWAW